MSVAEVLQKLRDDFMAGEERVNTLQALLEASEDEGTVQQVAIDVAAIANRIGERTRELERLLLAAKGPQ